MLLDACPKAGLQNESGVSLMRDKLGTWTEHSTKLYSYKNDRHEDNDCFSLLARRRC